MVFGDFFTKNRQASKVGWVGEEGYVVSVDLSCVFVSQCNWSGGNTFTFEKLSIWSAVLVFLLPHLWSSDDDDGNNSMSKDEGLCIFVIHLECITPATEVSCAISSASFPPASQRCSSVRQIWSIYHMLSSESVLIADVSDPFGLWLIFRVAWSFFKLSWRLDYNSKKSSLKKCFFQIVITLENKVLFLSTAPLSPTYLPSHACSFPYDISGTKRLLKDF